MPVVSLSRDRAALVVVDVQDKLFPKILALDELLRKIPALIQGCMVLGIPVKVTEQYTKGLGVTISPVREALGDHYQPIEKTCFSCLGTADLKKQFNGLRSTGRNQLILCGIETHVCILQTFIDAVQEDFDVFLCLDAISSRRALDRETAIRRMERGGAIVSTTEMILFELMQHANIEEFKSISALVKDF